MQSQKGSVMKLKFLRCIKEDEDHANRIWCGYKMA